MNIKPLRGSSRCAIAVVILLGLLSAPWGAPARADVLPVGSVVGDRTIAEWSADWWAWALSFPVEMSPLLDETGEFAPLGNIGGPIFFAVSSTGSPVSRKYTVPAGQYFLIPIYTYVWTYDDTCDNETCARQIVDSAVQAVTKMSVRIDGEPVQGLFSHYETTPVFSITVPDDGLYGPGEGGTFEAVSSGYWLMFEPLKPGRHHLFIDAVGPGNDPDEPSHFTTILQLNVEPRTKRWHQRGRDDED